MVDFFCRNNQALVSEQLYTTAPEDKAVTGDSIVLLLHHYSEVWLWHIIKAES